MRTHYIGNFLTKEVNPASADKLHVAYDHPDHFLLTNKEVKQAQGGSKLIIFELLSTYGMGFAFRHFLDPHKFPIANYLRMSKPPNKGFNFAIGMLTGFILSHNLGLMMLEDKERLQLHNVAYMKIKQYNLIYKGDILKPRNSKQRDSTRNKMYAQQRYIDPDNFEEEKLIECGKNPHKYLLTKKEYQKAIGGWKCTGIRTGMSTCCLGSILFMLNGWKMKNIHRLLLNYKNFRVGGVSLVFSTIVGALYCGRRISIRMYGDREALFYNWWAYNFLTNKKEEGYPKQLINF